MKRNMDLVRKILFKIEEHEHGYAEQNLSIDGFTAEQIGYHIWLMGKDRLLETVELVNSASDSPVARAISLLPAGHDFVDNARSDTTWAEAKKKVESVGGSVSLALLSQVLQSIVKAHLGLP
jgi:hypothetical protein